MPESVEEYYQRVRSAVGPDGRLPVAVEEMAGWDIFPFELDTLRIKQLAPLLPVEPDRRGEDPAHCRCAGGGGDPTMIWRNDRWVLTALESGLPAMLLLMPEAHHDLADLPADLAAEFGVLQVAVAASLEALPSVGRAHLARWGDGGAHLHLFFMGRPARAGQFRGSTLIDWEENLPRLPESVAAENTRFVAEHLVGLVGGRAVGPSGARPAGL